MNEKMKLLRHLISFILPITVLIIIPLSIESNFHLEKLWTTILGSIFICLGLAVVMLTVKMFIQIGKGTLAPWDPTKKISYRQFVRICTQPNDNEDNCISNLVIASVIQPNLHSSNEENGCR
jgi:hypothetical protein